MNDNPQRLLPSDHITPISLFIQQLHDPHEHVRQHAQAQLVALGQTAIPTLIEALHDREHWYAVIEVLIAIGEDALPALLACIRDDALVDFALHAIIGIGSPAVVPLLTLLNDQDSTVRTWSMVALGGLHDPRAIEPLRAMLRDPHDDVRQSAVRTLGILHATQSLPDLHWLQDHDPLPEVRQAAYDAIALIEKNT